MTWPILFMVVERSFGFGFSAINITETYFLLMTEVAPPAPKF